MRRQSRGLLLIEAILAAVVIAVGLVFVSRGLSSQLEALRTVEDYDTLMTLARSRLLTLEAERTAGRVTGHLNASEFDAPYQHYHWAITTQSLGADTLYREVILTVRRSDGPSSVVQLSEVWPTEWVPEEWL